MNKLLIIARREYAAIVRTRMFWVALLLQIVFMGVVGYGAYREGGRARRSGHAPATAVTAPAERPPDPDAAKVFRGMGAFVYIFLMYVPTMSAAQMLLTSLIEEKSSRVVEVLLAAVSPLQLLAGKILGLAAIGFTYVAVYVVALGAGAAFIGISDAMSLGGIIGFVPYFILGFLLVSAIFAGVGAACNTLKEAQTLMLPMTLILMLPVIAWLPIAQRPDGVFAVVLSILPLTSPMVMVLRLSLLPHVPRIEIIASLGLLAASVPAAIWAAAKVFRTGILMYGKPPTLRELLRWVRYK